MSRKKYDNFKRLERQARKKKLNQKANKVNNFTNLIHTGSYWKEFIESKKRNEELYNYTIKSIIAQQRKMKWRQLKKDLKEIQRLKIAA